MQLRVQSSALNDENFLSANFFGGNQGHPTHTYYIRDRQRTVDWVTEFAGGLRGDSEKIRVF